MDENVPDRAKEYLSNIAESAKWLLQIINDILDISKIEAKKMELEHIPFELHDIFAHCQAIITPKAVEKGVELYCYAEPSIGKKLLGDPIRLRQVILNLLSNAVKFTEMGIVKLLTSIKNTTEDKVTIHFEVKDSGIGMTAEQLTKIFDPFVQADDTITRKYGGTGLGLPITKNIIELMGGMLEVESTPGVGTKFTFEITFDMINAPIIELTDRIVINETERPTFEGEVLICEDNHMNQQLICDHLAKVGLKTVVADDGQEGVEIVYMRMKNGEKPFDLIFMDMHMPVMDGLEATAQLINMGCKTPIVALTANILVNDVETYSKNGMSGYLGKPFTTQELWKCLLTHLTPTGVSTLSESQKADYENFKQKLRLNFVKSNQSTYAEIRKALDNENIKLAHRLVHTLKGNAGQIGEKELQEVAAITERMLINNKNLLTEEQLDLLEEELNIVLEKYADLLTDKSRDIIHDVSTEQIKELFDKLEEMLENSNPQCMDLIDDLQGIEGAEELIQQLENFDFENAIDTFKKLKEKTVK
jgi:CheY-like chemotaxis protein